jgi:hypothetical protein
MELELFTRRRRIVGLFGKQERVRYLETEVE